MLCCVRHRIYHPKVTYSKCKFYTLTDYKLILGICWMTLVTDFFSFFLNWVSRKIYANLRGKSNQDKVESAIIFDDSSVPVDVKRKVFDSEIENSSSMITQTLTQLQNTKFLISGADVGVQDVYGFSPLHTSAALGFVQITSLLIVFGADVFSLTKQKELPVDVAKDISIIRLPTNEMCLRVHQELLLSAYLCMQCKRIWTYFYRFAGFFLSTLFTFLTALKVNCVSYMRKKCTKSKLRQKPQLRYRNDAISRDAKCDSEESEGYLERTDIVMAVKKKK